jgi:hypothetical protein
MGRLLDHWVLFAQKTARKESEGTTELFKHFWNFYYLFRRIIFFFSLRLPLAHLLRFDGRKNRRRNITRPGLRAGRRPRKNFKRQLSNFLTAFNFIFLIYFGVSVGYYYLAVPTAIGPFLFLQKEKWPRSLSFCGLHFFLALRRPCPIFSYEWKENGRIFWKNWKNFRSALRVLHPRHITSS